MEVQASISLDRAILCLNCDTIYEILPHVSALIGRADEFRRALMHCPKCISPHGLQLTRLVQPVARTSPDPAAMRDSPDE